MLIYRVLSAVVGIPLVILLVCKGGWFLTLPLCLLTIIGLYEFSDKARLQQIQVVQPVAYVVGLALILLTHTRTVPSGQFGHLSSEQYAQMLLGLLFLLVMGSLVVSFFRFHRDQQSPVVADVSATVLGALYVGFLFSFFVLLRGLQITEAAAIPGFARFPQEFGGRLLLLLFLVTWATDAGAYFTGKNLGRRKLTPASPNKTVEGALGGFLAAVVVALALGAWFQLPFRLTLPVGVLAGIMGQFGDLCKSILKRNLGTKDFGALIPGHGGVLDRFDSLLMNVPVVYFYTVLAM